MNITHYGFALFVFLLICGVIWFYSRIMRADKKRDKSSYEKEQRLFKMYQNIEDMLGGFEEYAEEAKAGLDERLKQAETLLGNLENAAGNKPAAGYKPAAARIVKSAAENAVESKGQKSDRTASEKSKRKVEDLIPQYIAKGLDKEEIAKALGISSREVSLIMEIKNIHKQDGKA